MTAASTTGAAYMRFMAAQTPIFGEDGQLRLARAHVHLSGTGGAGCATALNLVLAGLGSVSLNDPQEISEDNLNRLMFASPSDVGRPKVEILSAFLSSQRPYLKCDYMAVPTESPDVDPLFSQADVIVSCANTSSGRIAATQKAVPFGKPLFDVGVADGRESLVACVKTWIPGSDGACPACHFPDSLPELPRGEGLLSTVISMAGVLTAHLIVLYLTGHKDEALRKGNLFLFDAASFVAEAIWIRPRPGCRVCGGKRS